MKWPWWEEAPASEAEYAARRERMVETQLRRRGIRDERVLTAMRETPRHLFMAERFRSMAYDDSPVPLGYGQTVSQPFIVAYMLQSLRLAGNEKVLEIGAGSGYQTVLLSHLCRRVYAVEIIAELAAQAETTIRALNRRNAKIRCRDGYLGWPEAAPFDRVIVSAAPGHVPQPLVEQIKGGGRMILPLGDLDQRLLLVHKSPARKIYRRKLVPVKFVPMTGLAEKVN
jgi:protein-L-isoaspartate(D-aspartate) O-methyltransferase